MKEKLDDALLSAGDKMVDQANEAGNFLNLCLSVADGKVRCELTSWEFPTTDLLIAASTMANALADEWRKAHVPKPEPLPVASSLKHLIQQKMGIEDEVDRPGASVVVPEESCEAAEGTHNQG